METQESLPTTVSTHTVSINPPIIPPLRGSSPLASLTTETVNGPPFYTPFIPSLHISGNSYDISLNPRFPFPPHLPGWASLPFLSQGRSLSPTVWTLPTTTPSLQALRGTAQRSPDSSIDSSKYPRLPPHLYSSLPSMKLSIEYHLWNLEQPQKPTALPHQCYVSFLAKHFST
jgi:hypothetical protein